MRTILPVLILGCLLTGTPERVLAQSADTARPTFDVASVKPFQDIPSSFNLSRSGGRIRWTTTPMGLVMYAYHIQAFQETGMAHVPANFFAIASRIYRK